MSTKSRQILASYIKQAAVTEEQRRLLSERPIARALKAEKRGKANRKQADATQALSQDQLKFMKRWAEQFMMLANIVGKAKKLTHADLQGYIRLLDRRADQLKEIIETA